MKICHINLAKDFRGSERQTELLIRQLAAKRIEQSLVVRANSPLLSRLSDVDGVSFRTVRSRGLLQLGSCQGSDVIHAHERNATGMAYAAHRRYQKPLIVTRRRAVEGEGNPLNRKINAEASTVIALSHAIEKSLLESNPDLHVKTIHSMCSHYKITEAFRALKAGYAGKFVIGHISAKMDGDKGEHELIQVAHQLAPRYNNLHFVFLGAEKENKILARLAKGAEYVEFAGYKRNIGDFLNCFDLFAFPSLHEGVGSTLLDAMEQGVPIVASDAGAIPDIIQHEVNGLLTPQGNVNRLAEAIERLYKDEKLRQQLVLKSQEMIKQYFPESLAEQYLIQYQNAI